MAPPTIAPALAGGALIGLSASLLLMLTGRIAGISGIVGGLMTPPAEARARTERRAESAWRLAFLIGLLSGGVALFMLRPESFGPVDGAGAVSAPLVAVAGLLVGIGTTLGNGCTSGHGVCGMSRLSKRSIVATCVFMATGMLVTFAVRHVAGGR
ncbi:MAG: YeeE/YedE family protein [Labilithrix sp.]|nr:YeeE/YedE family protein [Labilithrix sp.]